VSSLEEVHGHEPLFQHGRGQNYWPVDLEHSDQIWGMKVAQILPKRPKSCFYGKALLRTLFWAKKLRDRCL